MSHDGDGAGRGVDRDSWFDEIDLDPDGAWLRMGTRSLGDRPWLIVDDRRDDELALKHRLLAERHDEVFAAAPDAGQASVEVHGLLVDALDQVGVLLLPDSDGVPRHPLDRSGRLVQEDLCLLRPTDGRWVLAAASLCFPSRWRLADKLERPLLAVHGPVAGYGQSLGDRVDSLLARLGEGIVWRRNWFVHPDGALFQPRRPPGGDPVVVGDRWRDELFCAANGRRCGGSSTVAGCCSPSVSNSAHSAASWPTVSVDPASVATWPRLLRSYWPIGV